MSEVCFHQKKIKILKFQKNYENGGRPYVPLIHFVSLPLKGAHFEIISEVRFHQKKNQNFKISEKL